MLFDMFPFLIFHEIIHFIAAVPGALFLWWKYKKIKYIFFFYLVIFFIDIDHFIDFFAFNGLNFSLNPITALYFTLSQKVIVPLHSWEILTALLLLFWKTKNKKSFILFLALISHILVDQFSYNTHILSYSLIYRVLNNFSMSSFNYLHIAL